jgi:GTP diphosphokinase / guanosine-3',5'-bis(diphosphate) 3'-diphosphatase
MHDVTQILHAASFAAHKHRDQKRKDVHASPYINHPLVLAHVLTDIGAVFDAATLCAALLHDTIEDTDTTPAELQLTFGGEIASIVLEVTDDKTLPKAARKRFQIEHAAHASEKAKLVKLADKICNLRDIAASSPVGWTLARQQAYFDWAKAVIDQLRGVNAPLEAAFDAAFAARPVS